MDRGGVIGSEPDAAVHAEYPIICGGGRAGVYGREGCYKRDVVNFGFILRGPLQGEKLISVKDNLSYLDPKLFPPQL